MRFLWFSRLFFASKKFRSYDQTCSLILFAWRSQIYSTHFLKFKELRKHIVKFNCFVATMCKPYNKHSLNADFRNCIALLQQKNGLLFKYINVVSSVFGIVKRWHPPPISYPPKGVGTGKVKLKTVLIDLFNYFEWTVWVLFFFINPN